MAGLQRSHICSNRDGDALHGKNNYSGGNHEVQIVPAAISAILFGISGRPEYFSIGYHADRRIGLHGRWTNIVDYRPDRDSAI